MYKSLKHLSPSELDELMDRYYAGEKVANLLVDYNLSIAPCQLVGLFPPEPQAKYQCEYCNQTLVIKRESRAFIDYNHGISFDESKLYCPICNHKPYKNQCYCENCKQKQIKHMQLQIGKIKPVDFDSLPFISKVYLGAICRGYLTEDLNLISPNRNRLLYPKTNYPNDTDVIYDNLIKLKAIKVSTNSVLSAFDESSDIFQQEYRKEDVIYNLNLRYSSKDELISNILYPTYYSDDLKNEANQLWRKIASAECIEYLLYYLNWAELPFNPGDKTKRLIDNMLNYYSVSQIYSFIFFGIKEAVWLCHSSPKKYIANRSIFQCELLFEKARESKKEVPHFRRNWPQSLLSEFFFNEVLAIGSLGFDMPPKL